MEVFALVGYLTIFPLGATIIGVSCLALYLRKRFKFALITGFTWIFYSLYEYLMYTRVLCTGECNIRVDLLLIYPVLLLLLLITAVLYFRAKPNVQPKT